MIEVPCSRRVVPWAVVVLVVLAGGAGCRPASQKRAESQASAPRVCHHILSKDLRCLDAVVAMAQDRSMAFVRKLTQGLDPERRARIERSMAKSLEEHRRELVETLRESLKDSFLDWCAQSRSDEQVRHQVQAMELCIRHADCAQYAACLGKVLDRYAKPVLPAALRAARGSGPGGTAGRPVPAHPVADSTPQGQQRPGARSPGGEIPSRPVASPPR